MIFVRQRAYPTPCISIEIAYIFIIVVSFLFNPLHAVAQGDARGSRDNAVHVIDLKVPFERIEQLMDQILISESEGYECEDSLLTFDPTEENRIIMRTLGDWGIDPNQRLEFAGLKNAPTFEFYWVGMRCQGTYEAASYTIELGP